MSKTRPPRLHSSLLAELEGTDWELVQGRRHWHLRISGRLIAVLPHGHIRESCHDRNIAAVRSNIRHHKAQGVLL